MTKIQMSLFLAATLTGCKRCGRSSVDDSGTVDTNNTDSADSEDSGDSVDSADSADSGDTAIKPVDNDEDGFETPEDCDDSNPDIHPDATEICNDGIDNDCNPESIGCDLNLGDADAVLLGEAASHYAGVSLDSAGDVNGDGYADLLVGAKQYDSEGGIEGAAYLVYGPISSKGGDLAELGVRLEGTEDSSNAGVQVVGLSDLDGDGMDEIVVSATTMGTDGMSKNGQVYFFHGSQLADSAPGSSLSLEEADASWTGISGYQWLGGGLADLGDVTGDSTPDLMIGGTGTAENATGGGAVYLVSGAQILADSEPQSIDEAVVATLHGIDERGYLGSRILGPGDMNGDGIGDLVLGAPLLNTNGAEAGSVFVLAGPISGEQNVDASNATLYGSTAGDRLGAAIGAAGDVNDDGYMDLWVSAGASDDGSANGGAAYLLYGSTDWTKSLNGVAADLAQGSILSVESGASAGDTMATGGDFDGDGILDVMLGASEYGNSSEGGAWLFLGPFEGSTDTDQARALMTGDEPGDHVATGLAFSPSLDGGETDWLVIGAWQDDDAGTDAGAVFLMGSLAE